MPKYSAVYGFPNNSGDRLTLLYSVLERAQDNPPTVAQLGEWLGTHRMPSTVTGYRQMLGRLGLFVTGDDDRYHLTSAAKAWLATRDNTILYGLLRTEFSFIREIVSFLRNPAATKDVRTLAARSGFHWDTGAQVNYRLQWLETLKVIEKRDGKWHLAGTYYEAPEVTEPPTPNTDGAGAVIPHDGAAPRPPVVRPDISSDHQSSFQLTPHQIEDIALAAVTTYLVSQGFEVGRAGQGTGLDLIASKDDELLLIEVKGTVEESPTSVRITGTELQAMQGYGTKMWLYVVSDLRNTKTITRFQNPGQLTARRIAAYELLLPRHRR